MCCCLILGVSKLVAQDKPVQPIEEDNSRRLIELKSKLDKIQQSLNDDEGPEKETSNNDIVDLLIKLDSKLDGLIIRQDSIVNVISRQDSIINILISHHQTDKDGAVQTRSFYVVVESHLTKDRAEIAQKKWTKKLNRDIRIIKSGSGNWYYVVLSKGHEADEIQKELKMIRKSVPTAWTTTTGNMD